MITVERVDFINIPTRDVARAKRFYGETLGLPLEKDRPTGAEYRAGQVTLGIWNPRTRGSSSAPTSPDSRCASRTSPRPAVELEEQGVQFDMETFDTGVCHMALLRDPDGNQIILHRRYAPLRRHILAAVPCSTHGGRPGRRS